MALHELLNRNKDFITQTYNQEQKNRTKSLRQPILHLKNNKINDQSIRQRSYLLQKYEKQYLSNHKTKQSKGLNNLMQIEINGTKFLQRTLIVQKNNSNLYKLWKKKQIKSQSAHDFSYNRQQYKSALQFYKNKDKTQRNHKQLPKSMTAYENNRKIIKSIDKKVQILPASFTLKNLNRLKGASCVLIEYQQHMNKQGLHVRKNLQTQQQKNRQNRAKSSISLNQHLDKQSFQKQMIQRNFLIESQRLKIDQRPQIKKQYVNIFYQYRKAKIKYQKQKQKQRKQLLKQQKQRQLKRKLNISAKNCQPWRPISSKSRKQIDLAQFYHPQQ